MCAALFVRAAGAYLASGSDDKSIILWRHKDGADEASWGDARLLLGHRMDVCDLAWAPDGTALVSGSVDNRVLVWDVRTLKVACDFAEHSHYVQGVAWAPCGRSVLSVSTDRTCRVYAHTIPAGKKGGKAPPAQPDASVADSVQRGWACTAVLGKRVLAPRESKLPPAVPAAAPAAAPADTCTQPPPHSSREAAAGDGATASRLFLGDGVQTFCRRPAWSPDAQVVVIPCGQLDRGAPTTLVFARGAFDAPIAHLPVPKPTIAVRFCPLLFKLRREQPAPEASQPLSERAAETLGGATDAPAASARPWLPLPHRTVWAVLTADSILVYDSESALPLAVVQGTHFAPLTDLAWAADGRLLVVTSHDGYATLIRFDEGQLGTPLPAAEQPLVRAQPAPGAPTERPLTPCAASPADECCHAAAEACEAHNLGAHVHAEAPAADHVREPVAANAAAPDALAALPTELSACVDPAKKKKRISPVPIAA